VPALLGECHDHIGMPSKSGKSAVKRKDPPAAAAAALDRRVMPARGKGRIDYSDSSSKESENIVLQQQAASMLLSGQLKGFIPPAYDKVSQTYEFSFERGAISAACQAVGLADVR
jgi:hypothetical protein